MAKFSKEFIVSELQRLAAANGGKAPGRKAFIDDTGISENQINKYWTGYSSLVKEAGFEAKHFSIQKLPDENVLAGLAEIALKVGRMPTIAEMRKARQEGALAFSPDVVERFGTKTQQEAAPKAFCKDKSEYSALIPHLNTEALEGKAEEVGALDLWNSLASFIWCARESTTKLVRQITSAGGTTIWRSSFRRSFRWFMRFQLTTLQVLRGIGTADLQTSD